MLVSPLITGSMTQVQASPDPLFTIHLVGGIPVEGFGIEPEFFFDIGAAIKAELAKIGINVEIVYYGWIDHYWNWTATWEEGGWDMNILFEWGWWMPTDLVWFEGCYSAAGQPPYGWNVFAWQNARADKLLHSAMTTLDKAQRKQYIDTWQEEYMHDPPAPVMYYPIVYEVTDVDLEGWDKVVGFWDSNRLHFAGTTLEDNVTLKYGCAEDLPALNPLFNWNYAQEAFSQLIYSTLMKISKDPETGQYEVVSSLASDYPVYSLDGETATVHLRENVTWHDGWKFNATDVKFTFDAVLDPATRSWAYGDFAPVIESVEIIDEYTVVFHLKAPYAAFDSLLANTWGGFIVPEHILRDVPHQEWETHPTNTQTPMPGTGPFKFVQWVKGEFFEVEVNKNYFLGEPLIDHIICRIITDPAEGLTALQNHEIDLGNAWEATMDEIEAMMLDPTLKVLPTLIPAITQLGFNLHHPILSNRYVRQAIAHAIPYDHIINDVLPTISRSGNRATAPVTPTHGWLYNTQLQPYEHNITKAQQYLDMWLYSQPLYAPEDDPKVLDGPVGDTDFSGFVDLTDFYIWVKNFGKAPDQWPWSPGHDVDPDFDNNGLVELDDFYMWTGAWGSYYPFEGAR